MLGYGIQNFVNNMSNHGLDDQGSFPGNGRVFSLRHHVLTGSEQWIKAALCLAVKRSESDINH